MSDDEYEYTHVTPQVVASLLQGTRDVHHIKAVPVVNRTGTIQTGLTKIGGKTPIGDYATYDEAAGELVVDVDGLARRVDERMTERFNDGSDELLGGDDG